MKVCSALGCRAIVTPDHLTCPAHWRLVPRELQMAITIMPRESRVHRNLVLGALREIAEAEGNTLGVMLLDKMIAAEKARGVQEG